MAQPPRGAAAAAPPPEPLPPYRPPAWAERPPGGVAIAEVVKGGRTLQRVVVIKPAHVFGRHPAADTVMEQCVEPPALSDMPCHGREGREG